MKKVLILAYDFPPYVSVGGQRPSSWYTHLKQFDIHPIVITRNWDNCKGDEYDFVRPSLTQEKNEEETEFGTLIKAPFKPHLGHRLYLKYGPKRYKFLRKVFTGFVEIAQFHVPIGPKREIYNSARDYLSKNKVDAIIATGEPFVLFHYANKLAKEFDTPWVADYRDPWSDNFHLSRFLKGWSSKLEQRTLLSVSYIQTVGPFFQNLLQSRHLQKQVYIVENGYEPISQFKEKPQDNEVLSFGFVGTIYNWHPLISMLSAFDIFSKQYPDFPFLIKFFGTNNPEEIKETVASKFPRLKGKIDLLEKKPRPQLLEELQKINCLLLFNYYDFMGTKIYDYLLAKRHILLLYQNDKEANDLRKKHFYSHPSRDSSYPQIELIKRTESGTILENKEAFIAELKVLKRTFEVSGKIECQTKEIDQFSRGNQVKIMTEILKKELFR